MQNILSNDANIKTTIGTDFVNKMSFISVEGVNNERSI